MKFAKFKIKRCKDCKYYRRLGTLNAHICHYDKTRIFGFKIRIALLNDIPLICLKKKEL